VTERAENARIDSAEYLKLFGFPRSRCRASELWEHLFRRLRPNDLVLDRLFEPLETISQHGTLASRICTALGDSFSMQDLKQVYEQVADCLDRREPFQP